MGRERTRWSRTMNFTAVIGFAVLIVFLATPSDSGAQETTGDASTNKAACPYMKGGEQPPCPRAAAGMPPCPCPAKAGICAASIQKRLNLTEQQVADMDRIRADYQTQAADLSERARGLSMKMETLLRDPEAKTADIEKLNRKLIKLKSQKKQKQLGLFIATSGGTHTRPGQGTSAGGTQETPRCRLHGQGLSERVPLRGHGRTALHEKPALRPCLYILVPAMSWEPMQLV